MQTNMTFRKFAGKSDYPKMAGLIQAISTADGHGVWSTAEEIEKDYSDLVNCNPETDMQMVEDTAGTLVAYARVFWSVDDNNVQRFFFVFNIHPEHRTLELNRDLLKWVEKHSQELASTLPHDGRRALYAQVRNADIETVFLQALDSEAYTPIRYFNLMARDLSEPINPLPLPDGLTVRLVAESEYRILFDGMDEAFLGHWGHAPATDENYKNWLTSPTFNPKLWQVAWDGDQVAGGVLNFIDEPANQQFDFKRGWADPIFVRRPWRKRGLARALIMRSLQLLKDAGMTEARLGVDTQNASSAFALYESCGFKRVVRSVFYEKEIKV
jgi:GNAT superfamily N-acetyltransferase